MKNNPLQPHERGKAGDSRTIRDPQGMPNLFSAFRTTPPQAPFVPPGIMVPQETIDSLRGLLVTIADTFREHGMVDLAAQADEVAALL